MKIPSAFVWLGGAALTETLIIFSFSSVFSSANGAPSPASQNLIAAPAAAPNGTRTYNLAWKPGRCTKGQLIAQDQSTANYSRVNRI